MSAAPTAAQSFLGSAYTAAVSIASKDGFTIQETTGPTGIAAATATSTTSGNAAASGMPVGLSAAALGGIVGVVMAL